MVTNKDEVLFVPPFVEVAEKRLVAKGCVIAGTIELFFAIIAPEKVLFGYSCLAARTDSTAV